MISEGVAVAGPQAAGRRRARRRPDLRRDQGRGRLQRRPGQGPDRARARGPGPGPRAGLRQGRASTRRRSATSRPTAPARRSATWPRSSALTGVFARGRRGRRVAARSARSSRMIGHTKCAAGLAGLINATLALHHGSCRRRSASRRRTRGSTSPDGPVPRSTPRPGPGSTPTAEPSPPGGGERLRLRRDELPRRPRGLRATTRAGRPARRSATGRPSCSSGGPPTDPGCWPASIGSPSARRRARAPALRDLAHAAGDRAPTRRPGPTLAIVAASLDDLPRQARDGPRRDRGRPGRARRPARRLLRGAPAPSAARRWRSCSRARGRSRSAMLGDLAVDFPEVREAFEDVRRGTLARERREPIGPCVFPPPAFDDETATSPGRAALRGDRGRPAGHRRGGVGLLALLARLGLEPDMVAGPQLRRAGRAPRGRRAWTSRASPSSPRPRAVAARRGRRASPARWPRCSTGSGGRGRADRAECRRS